MDTKWPLRDNLTIYNRTTMNNYSVSLNLAVNLTCSGAVLAILIASGLILFIRFRRKFRNTPHRDKPANLPEEGNAPRLDSFRNKRQRDQEFPYINYGIEYFMKSSSLAAEEIPEVIYDVPRARGTKRQCPFDEDFQRDIFDAKKFSRVPSASSSIMSAFDSSSASTLVIPCDALPWSETLQQSENEDIITDMKCIQNYDAADIMFTTPQQYDEPPLPMKCELDQSLSRRDSSDNTPVYFKGYSTRSLPLMFHKRRYMCSLENMKRTWSFQSLLRHWHQYCTEAMGQANQ